jgi:hypothetical protein
MTDTEKIAMLEAEVADLRRRLARYESATVLTHGLTDIPMPMMRPLRKRRGPVTRQHPGDVAHTVHKGSWETFGPGHTPTPLQP